MDELTRSLIRFIFLEARPTLALFPASQCLGMTLPELRREIEEGVIVAVSLGLMQRVSREQLMAAALRQWELSTIEEALGADAVQVLPEALRLVGLRARVPRYQREMLRFLAKRQGSSVDAVLTRGLDDVASAHAEELSEGCPDSPKCWPGRNRSASGRHGLGGNLFPRRAPPLRRAAASGRSRQRRG